MNGAKTKYGQKTRGFKDYSYWGKLFLFFLVYFFTARIGLSFDAVSRFATLLWLPSGIAMATILLFGYRFLPGIFVAAFLVNLLNGAHLFTALGIGAGNTLEATTATYLLQRTGFQSSLERLRDVLLFVLLAAPLGAFVSATLGTTSLFLGNTVSFQAYHLTWQAWLIGDLISIIVLTPLLLVWKLKPTLPRPRWIIEIATLLLLTIIVGIVIFRSTHQSASITYLVFPPLLWASLRFNQRTTIMVTAILSTLAIAGTVQGVGPFAGGRLSERLILLQSYLIIIAVTSLILGAIESERHTLAQRKDEFISLASHELKNPLASMKAFTQMGLKALAKGQTTPAKRYLKKVAEQTERLERLINDLLDISKIQAGKLEFKKESFPLLDLINDTVEATQMLTKTHKIIVRSTGHRNGLHVFIDKERISQVLTNLLLNAIKYSPNGRRIIVTVGRTRKEAMVCVKDFGIGITLQQQEKIFERYYRAHDTEEKTYPGLGIGLYISQEIIKQSGGEMRVESKEGSGSSFRFTLPLSR